MCVETAHFDDVVNVIDERQRAVQFYAEHFEIIGNRNDAAGNWHGRWKIWVLQPLSGSEVDHVTFLGREGDHCARTNADVQWNMFLDGLAQRVVNPTGLCTVLYVIGVLVDVLIIDVFLKCNMHIWHTIVGEHD